jgi:hypothetical protein
MHRARRSVRLLPNPPPLRGGRGAGRVPTDPRCAEGGASRRADEWDQGWCTSIPRSAEEGAGWCPSIPCCARRRGASAAEVGRERGGPSPLRRAEGPRLRGDGRAGLLPLQSGGRPGWGRAERRGAPCAILHDRPRPCTRSRRDAPPPLHPRASPQGIRCPGRCDGQHPTTPPRLRPINRTGRQSASPALHRLSSGLPVFP